MTQRPRGILGPQQQLGQSYIAGVSINLMSWTVGKERANIRIPRCQCLACSSQASFGDISSLLGRSLTSYDCRRNLAYSGIGLINPCRCRLLRGWVLNLRYAVHGVTEGTDDPQACHVAPNSTPEELARENGCSVLALSVRSLMEIRDLPTYLRWQPKR